MKVPNDSALICCGEIAKLRRHRYGKMSVRELAERIADLGFDGPEESRIRQFEAGGRPGASGEVRDRANNIRLREVLAIAAGLDVPLGDLIGFAVDANGMVLVPGDISARIAA